MRKPNDDNYRQMIVNNLDDSILVEAGAGSGKTTKLVDRMLALIAAGKCTVDKIAAVTFTRKAAAELKGDHNKSGSTHFLPQHLLQLVLRSPISYSNQC